MRRPAHRHPDRRRPLQPHRPRHRRHRARRRPQAPAAPGPARRPGGVAAVLDRELAAVGDPLLDVAYLLANWPGAGEPLTPVAALGTAVLEPGWPSRAELAARYAAATGRDLAGLAWYTVLVFWKLAVLFEYSRRRGVDPYYRDPALVESFLAAAHRAAS